MLHLSSLVINVIGCLSSLVTVGGAFLASGGRIISALPTPSSCTPLSQPLVPLVDEFAARLCAELDYVAVSVCSTVLAGKFTPSFTPPLTSSLTHIRQEGHNCERFRALYADVPRVRTPSIYWQNTSR